MKNGNMKSKTRRYKEIVNRILKETDTERGETIQIQKTNEDSPRY